MSTGGITYIKCNIKYKRDSVCSLDLFLLLLSNMLYDNEEGSNLTSSSSWTRDSLRAVGKTRAVNVTGMLPATLGEGSLPRSLLAILWLLTLRSKREDEFINRRKTSWWRTRTYFSCLAFPRSELSPSFFSVMDSSRFGLSLWRWVWRWLSSDAPFFCLTRHSSSSAFVFSRSVSFIFWMLSLSSCSSWDQRNHFKFLDLRKDFQ